MPHRPSIVADIGGTNTRVALTKGAQMLPDTIRRYRNTEYPGLEPILKGYLTDAGTTCAGACVAVAGPVRDGAAEMTNLDWSMTDASIAEATGASTVSILNDLQAQGHALGHLHADSLRQIIAGPDLGPDAGAMAAKLVIGVGTGFNAAPVHETRRGRLVAASECGHVNLPVRSEDDLRLMHHIAGLPEAHGFPSVEDVLSGRGLERTDAFTGQEMGKTTNRTAAQIMAAMADPTDLQAQATGQIFTRMLAMVAGNLALTHLPFGGIFLIGGVSRAITPHLAGFGFTAAFHDKGRFAEFMQGFPVWLIEDDYAALRGCAVHLAHLSTA